MRAHKLVEAMRKYPNAEALIAPIMDSVCFYAGRHSLQSEYREWMQNDLKLPFSSTLIEFDLDCEGNYVFAHLVSIDETIELTAFVLIPDPGVIWCVGQSVFSGDGVEITREERGAEGDIRRAYPSLGFTHPGLCRQFRAIDGLRIDEISKMAAMFISALNCSNIEYIDNPAPEALNRKRVKAGKVPLFSYKTLHIKVGPKEASINPMGGTHASPRVHLRRGHIRRLTDLRTTWVSACVVGNKELGMIHKEYAVTA